jgi:formate hydrogenlyase subunit 4
MALATLISVIEVPMAKMRLFRVIDFLNIAFVLSVLGIVILAMGK